METRVHDGKRLDALDVVYHGILYIHKGGSLREGGQKVRPDWRLVDDGKRLDALDVLYRSLYQ